MFPSVNNLLLSIAKNITTKRKAKTTDVRPKILSFINSKDFGKNSFSINKITTKINDNKRKLRKPEERINLFLIVSKIFMAYKI
jgi:hypothetical protein